MIACNSLLDGVFTTEIDVVDEIEDAVDVGGVGDVVVAIVGEFKADS